MGQIAKLTNDATTLPDDPRECCRAIFAALAPIDDWPIGALPEDFPGLVRALCEGEPDYLSDARGGLNALADQARASGRAYRVAFRRIAELSSHGACDLPSKSAGRPADATLLRLGDELDRARAREKALIDSKTSGDTYEAAYNATSCVVDQIEKQQARTLEGVQVKVRAVMWCHQGEPAAAVPFRLSHYQRTTDVRLAESIVLDLAGMSIA